MLSPLNATDSHIAALCRARDNTDILSAEADADGDRDVAAMLNDEAAELDAMVRRAMELRLEVMP